MCRHFGTPFSSLRRLTQQERKNNRQHNINLRIRPVDPVSDSYKCARYSYNSYFLSDFVLSYMPETKEHFLLHWIVHFSIRRHLAGLFGSAKRTFRVTDAQSLAAATLLVQLRAIRPAVSDFFNNIGRLSFVIPPDNSDMFWLSSPWQHIHGSRTND